MMQNGSERENVNYGGKSKQKNTMTKSIHLLKVPNKLFCLSQPWRSFVSYYLCDVFAILTGFLLAQLNISYPMLFKLVNGQEKKHSHAGVLEFIAEEGRVYLPQWVQFKQADRKKGRIN